jgi:hypothetical protein
MLKLTAWRARSGHVSTSHPSGPRRAITPVCLTWEKVDQTETCAKFRRRNFIAAAPARRDASSKPLASELRAGAKRREFG